MRHCAFLTTDKLEGFVTDDTLTAEPLRMERPRATRLEQLLEKITDDNLHGEINTGELCGNESW